MTKTTFSWTNYTRPTPGNLLRFSQFIQGLLAGITATASIMEANKWIPILTSISIIFVNQLVQFFGSVIHDEQTESVTTQFPSGEEVTVTHEVKP